MTLQIEAPQLITLVLAFLGLLIGFGKYMLAQIDRRITGIEQQNRTEAEGWKRIERELLELRAELPVQYVRREDYVRGQTVIESKLDSLYSKLETIQLRNNREQP